jgi:hypothetical protein
MQLSSQWHLLQVQAFLGQTEDSDNSIDGLPLDNITTEVFGAPTLSQAPPTGTPGADMAVLLASNPGMFFS